MSQWCRAGDYHVAYDDVGPGIPRASTRHSGGLRQKLQRHDSTQRAPKALCLYLSSCVPPRTPLLSIDYLKYMIAMTRSLLCGMLLFCLVLTVASKYVEDVSRVTLDNGL